MATDTNRDPLRNPQVDYERADLSPRGILLFLIGLFIAGVFIELVIWGMFRFMARSEVLFPQPKQNPMAISQQQGAAASKLQNTPGVNLDVFPMPRLQTNDAGEMRVYVDSERKLLDAQPFTESNGTVHLPIALAMQLIQERGLPVRPNSPPNEDVNTQTAAGNTKMLDMQAGQLGPTGAPAIATKPTAAEGKMGAGEKQQP